MMQQTTVVTDNRPYYNRWTQQTEQQEVKFALVNGEFRPLTPCNGRYYVNVNGTMRQIDPNTGNFIS